MRQISSLSFSLIVLLGLVLTFGSSLAAAQDRWGNDHPLVGSWNVESDPGDAEYSPRLVSFAADGTAFFVSGQQTMGVGAWQPTGDTTAVVSFAVATNGPAYILIRARIDVAPDRLSFTGTFTFEAVFDPAGGGTSGEVGPGTLTGTRVSAEAPGTPTASFEDIFPQPAGTPVATPGA
jgi:hypothetical protein